MIGFQAELEINNRRDLFGHGAPEALLDQVLGELKSGTNIHLYGERRSGKTSLLQCCRTAVLADHPSLLPIYLNYRRHPNIRGAADVHRFLLANAHSVALAAGVPGSPGDLSVLPFSQKWEDAYNVLRTFDDFRVPGLLDQYVRHVSARGFGIILLIDEYEHLLLQSYHGVPGSFFLIRDLSTTGGDGAAKPLCYVISGAEKWQDICDACGSPELNTTTSGFEIGPISPGAFFDMWRDGVAGTPEAARPRVDLDANSIERLYVLSGGWPHYAKVIGHELFMGRLSPDEVRGLAPAILERLGRVLGPHFDVIWKRLSPVEREVLAKAKAVGIRDGAAPAELIARGLLSVDVDGITAPCGDLWGAYVRLRIAEDVAWNKDPRVEHLRATLRNHLAEIRELVLSDDHIRIATVPMVRHIEDWIGRCSDVGLLERARGLFSASGTKVDGLKAVANISGMPPDGAAGE